MKSRALDRARGKIKRVLAQKRMGEKNLAKALGLTERETSQLLAGQRKLELSDLEAIAAALGVSIGFILREEDESEFADGVKDPRLTDSENAVLIEKLSEMREAFIALILKRRSKPHDRDLVAG